MFKSIIFDLDGTLLDTEYAIFQSLHDVFREINFTPTSDLSVVLGIPGKDGLEKLGLENAEPLVELWAKRMGDYPFQLFPEVEKTLRLLKDAGSHLGIITSKTRREYLADFPPFGLENLFDLVMTVEDSPRPKPTPDPILTFLKKTGFSQEDVIYIGDSPYDRECAKSAGVAFGLANWGRNGRPLLDSDYYFASPLEIADLVTGGGK